MVQHFKKLDWLLIVLAVLLVTFGLISIYSSDGDNSMNFEKQILWLAMGIFLTLVISFFDYRILKNYKAPVIIIYIFSLFMIAGVLVFGVTVRGAESWYRVGPVTLEPVEFMKIILILVLAKYFSMRHIEMYRTRHIVVSGLYVLLPAGLVFVQPDIGSVIIIISVWLGMMVVAGIKAKQIIALGVLGILVFSMAWLFVFHDYQKARFLSFVNPETDPRGSGYNVQQSVIAIGSGGVLGKGVGEGTQTQLGFLPESQTDFIYGAIFEEMGLVGALILLFCFAFFIWRLMGIAKYAQNNFARLAATGFAIMIVSQIFINMGMGMGLLPITGIPLPFVSYGGSSLISLFTMLGVIQSIKAI